LLRSLSEAEEQLSGLLAGSAPRPPGDDALVIVLRADGVAAHLGGPLLYYPFLPVPEEPPTSLYAAGEDLEFQVRDFGRAAAVFRKQARSEDPAIRAGALVRLAETHGVSAPANRAVVTLIRQVSAGQGPSGAAR
jgi:hypothetical protein